MNSMIQQSMPNQAVLANEMKALQKNPVQYLLSKRLNIPTNIGNNPQAIVQHLVSTGQVTQQQVAQARSMLGM